MKEGSKDFLRSVYRVFRNELRRDIMSSRTLVILAIFVMFDLLMLFSFGYLMTADPAESGSGAVPQAFEDPTAKTWSNLAVVLGGAFYFSLLGIGAACFFGAGALARDLKSGALRLVQATPTSREATYLGRNLSVFFISYFLAAIGSILMMAGFIIIGGLAELDIATMVEIVLELGLKMQIVIAISILVGTTTTAALGVMTKSQTIAAIGGISFFILIDSFLGIGATLFPEEWHLENLSFGYHQSEMIRWLIGRFDADYEIYEPIDMPLGSVAALVAIPAAALLIGTYFYRNMDLD
ncbi:MAG: ABC transporter permease [Candidatus Hodarchaeales archaeon]|jgi:ABC-type transport system involved in multi-copper enzyme maturation permease subunit